MKIEDRDAGGNVSRLLLVSFPVKGRLAQLVEHCVHTAGVTGSSPVAPTLIYLRQGFRNEFISYDETAYESNKQKNGFSSDY